MRNLRIREDYVARAEPADHLEEPLYGASIVHQPEIYEAVRYLASVTGRTAVMDLGCGNGRKLVELAMPIRIGVDIGANIEFCRRRHSQEIDWVEADFASRTSFRLAELGNSSVIVVCADVIEHLVDPTILLTLLTELYRRGAIIVTSTPDRTRNHGAEHCGPPPNEAHVREWSLAEYIEMLEYFGLPVTYGGWTLNNSVDRQLKTIVTISDPDLHRAASARSPLRPLAIISAHNEVDMIGEVIGDWLRQGCDVHLLDNWSDDETPAIARCWADRAAGRVVVERFPDCRPNSFIWSEILHRKELIAAQFPGRWVIHSDADELRRTPFRWLNFADSLDFVASTGANRVDFTVCNFYPTQAAEPRRGGIERSMLHFQFGTRPGYLAQAKAWLQGPTPIALVPSGGHQADFPGAKTFRYKFLLKHYPLRSPAHARRKIFEERNTRFELEKETLGAHNHYDKYPPEHEFIWPIARLRRWHDDLFWQMNGLLVITDMLKRRVEQGLLSADL